MKYITVKEVAELWDIKERRVRTLAENGRIRGAKYEKNKWLIPIVAEKPIDRRKVNKNIPTNIFIDDEEYGNGFFGKFGGCYLPNGFKKVMEPILLKYRQMFNSLTFRKELDEFRARMQFRPTPLYFAENFSKYLGSAGIYIKREDLNYTNSMYINQTISLAYLARYLNKKKMVAECGDANYAVALSYACNYVGIELELYVGMKDYRKQKSVIDQVKLMGATLVIVTKGNQTIYNATNSCFQEFLLNEEEYFYCFHDAIGPHPFPTIVRDFQAVISKEIKEQCLAIEGRLPDVVMACVGGGSNAIGTFYNFIEDKEVQLIGCEAAGRGIDTFETAATINTGKLGIFHGMKSYFCQDEYGQIAPVYSISAGLDYPGIGPEHANLHDIGRAEYVPVTDEESVQAFEYLSRMEGIIPAIESSHAVAAALREAKKMTKDQIMIICLSGRGDKDVYSIAKYRGVKLDEE